MQIKLYFLHRINTKISAGILFNIKQRGIILKQAHVYNKKEWSLGFRLHAIFPANESVQNRL